MARNAGLEAKRVAGALTSMRIDELISHLAIGIATGQTELDNACMEIAKFMGEARIAFGKKAGTTEPDELSLIELGFSPNFYQFVDSILEVKVSISSQYEHTYEYETEKTKGYISTKNNQREYENKGKTKTKGATIGYAGGNLGISNYMSNYSSNSSGSSSYESKRLNVTTVDAKYSSSYNYSVEGSSTIKTKIVPIPPPQVFEERVRALVAQMKEEEEYNQALFDTIATIPGIIDQAQSIGGEIVFAGGGFGDGDTLLGWDEDDGRAEFTKERATSLNEKLVKLEEEYNKLDADNWAVAIGSGEDRESNDNLMVQITENGQNILGAFTDTDELMDEADMPDATLSGYLQKIREGLLTLRDKLQAILEKLEAETTETE